MEEFPKASRVNLCFPARKNLHRKCISDEQVLLSLVMVSQTHRPIFTDPAKLVPMLIVSSISGKIVHLNDEFPHYLEQSKPNSLGVPIPRCKRHL